VIDRFGTSRRIEVLGSTSHASEEAKRRLVKTIEASRFRPRLTNGEFARASPVELRYCVRE